MDRVYYIEDKIVHFEAPIDLNSNGISGLEDGTEDGDAVTVKQLNEAIKNLDHRAECHCFSRHVLAVLRAA